MNVKLANIQLSTPMPQSAKNIANECIKLFEMVDKNIDVAQDHIDMLHSSFDKFPNTETDRIWNARAFLRNYRDQALKNFNEVKSSSFNAVSKIEYFKTDLNLEKIVESFISDIEEMNNMLSSMKDLFDDLRDKDFIQNITKLIGNIIKQCVKIKEIIKDRIFDYINKNILNKDWYNEMKEKNKD